MEAVSAIICVFNGERYLAEAIRSILAQSSPPLEIIVVDNGSTDSTAAIARSFPGVRYVFKEHSTLPTGRNRALREARGELIAFIDHDDVWLPEKLERQAAFLREHPDVDVAGCHARHIVEGERPAWLLREHAEQPQPCWLPSALLIRASTFARCGIFDETYSHSEDYEWLMRAAQAGARRLMMPDLLLHRRVHEQNLTNDRRQNHRDTFRALHAAAKRASAQRP